MNLRVRRVHLFEQSGKAWEEGRLLERAGSCSQVAHSRAELAGCKQLIACPALPITLPRMKTEHPDIVMTRAVDSDFLAKFAEGVHSSLVF